MRLSKVTHALIAAGFGAGLATGYTHLDALSVGAAHAAPQVAATSADVRRPCPPIFPISRRSSIAPGHRSSTSARSTPRARARPISTTSTRTAPITNSSSASAAIPNAPGLRPQQPSRGVGSGFIVSPDGYIVTNAHVVDGATEVVVRLTDRREFTAKVVGADKRTDIAVVKIDAKNLPALDLAAKPAVKRGEWVIAIGSPFGFENSVSAGVVSGVHRALPDGQMVPFIQTDVAVNPGNSGGPLLNAAGQVVGVNAQIYSRSGGYMGLSFAIPADVAARVADQLKTHGKVQHGRLGIGIQGLDQALAQSFGLADANGASSARWKRAARRRRRASSPAT